MSEVGRLLLVGWLLAACGATEKSADPAAGGAASGGRSARGGNVATSGAAGKLGVVPPPAQGAANFLVFGPSPAVAGKQCPAGDGFFDAIPQTPPNVGEDLDDDTYFRKVIDGQDGVVLKCSVVGDGSFTFEGELHQNGRSLVISEGVLPSTLRGSAKIALTDAQQLSSTLTSSEPCVVDAMGGDFSSLQIKSGSMWARFDCEAIEAPPSDSCKANGYFVLENCAQN